MMKFNGERWELFGPIIEDAGPVKQLGSIGGSPPAVALPATPAVSFRNSKFQPAARSRCTATALDSFCAIGADAFALGVAGVEHEIAAMPPRAPCNAICLPPVSP
jgi:hypothetical protein